MIISYHKYCRPHNRFCGILDRQQNIGLPNQLNILYIEQGQCTLSSAGSQPFPASAGSFVLAAVPLHVIPITPCHVQSITLDGQAALEAAASLDKLQLLNQPAVPGALALLYRLLAETPLPENEASAIGYTLLCMLGDAQTAAKPLPALVASAIAEIHQNYNGVYGVEELAENLGVSKSHLVRSFSAVTGTTPGHYLNAVRIETAKRLLLEYTYPLEIVAGLCGFSGANYLCRVFKKAVGVSPTAWRKTMRHSQKVNNQPDAALLLESLDTAAVDEMFL